MLLWLLVETAIKYTKPQMAAGAIPLISVFLIAAQSMRKADRYKGTAFTSLVALAKNAQPVVLLCRYEE